MCSISLCVKTKKAMKKRQEETRFLIETQTKLMHVVFGMPSINCSRYGLCRIEGRSTVPLDDRAIQQQPNTALAYMHIEETSVSFTFLGNSMTERDQKKFFGNNTFLIEEDKALSPYIAAQFGLEAATILRGSYAIKKRDNDFKFSAKMMFNLQDNTLYQTTKVA